MKILPLRVQSYCQVKPQIHPSLSHGKILGWMRGRTDWINKNRTLSRLGYSPFPAALKWTSKLHCDDLNLTAGKNMHSGDDLHKSVRICLADLLHDVQYRIAMCITSRLKHVCRAVLCRQAGTCQSSVES